MKISCVPPEMQTLALGAESARSEVPQLQGQKRRNKMYQNRVHLIGYLGKNPEQKSAKESDRKYTVFSLATKRAWKGADEEWHSKTDWHRIIAWNGLGEYAAAKGKKQSVSEWIREKLKSAWGVRLHSHKPCVPTTHSETTELSKTSASRFSCHHAGGGVLI